MKTTKLHFLASAVLCSVLSGWGAERAAVIYSDYYGGVRKNEFARHFATLGISSDAYLNTRIDELTARLTEYDMVVATTLANYVQTVDLRKHAAQWRAWLRQGGIFVVVDANYASVLNNFVTALGPEFAVGSDGCSLHQANAALKPATADMDDPLMFAPLPLGRRIEADCNPWQHLTGLGPEWRKPVKCPHQEAVFAYREFGDGLVAMTCAAEMAARSTGEALLANLLAYRKAMKDGLRTVSLGPVSNDIDELTVGRAVTLQDRGHRHRRLRFRLTAANDGRTAVAEMTAEPDATGVFKAAPRVTIFRRGRVDCVLKAFSETGDEVASFKWAESQPLALSFALLRKHIYPGDYLKADAKIAAHRLGAPSLRGLMWRVDGGEWRSSPATSCVLRVETTALTPGRHTIEARLDYAPEFLAARTPDQIQFMDWGKPSVREFFMHAEPKYRMRDDHVLLKNGQPVFPIGWYSVLGGGLPTSTCLEMVREIAGWGYNLAHVGMMPDDAATGSHGLFLDECARLGVDIITEHASPETAAKYRSKAAVLGWNPGDEPVIHGTSPAEMFARYDRFKQVDPDHLVYTVLCRPDQYANYAAGTDILSPDPYPLPGGLVDAAYRLYCRAKAAANAADTALWAVPQAFGYPRNKPPMRPPTGREFKAMSYLAIMAGAKGLVYYAHHDGSFCLNSDAPDMREAARTFPAELKPFIPFVLNGRMTLLLEGAGGVHAAGWILGEKHWLVAVNPAHETKRARFDFAGKSYDVTLDALESRSCAAEDFSTAKRER